MEKSGRPSLVLRLLAAFAGAAVATTGHAQMLAPSSGAGLSKSDAILGAPSRLEAILAAQAGGGASSTLLALNSRNPYSLVRPAPALQSFEAPVVTAASLDRPDIFNSVAVPINVSPLDNHWSRVARGNVGGRAGRYAASLRSVPERTRIEAVNAFVNARVAFASDSRQYGLADRWSAAADTLSRGRGDCEDYAIAKMAMLRRAGLADKDLYLVVLKDLARRADHAVLVVRTQGRFLVLDNGTDRMLDSAAISDYRPVLTFTAGQRFTHGYRRAPLAAPAVMANNDAVPAVVTTAVAFAGMPTWPYALR